MCKFSLQPRILSNNPLHASIEGVKIDFVTLGHWWACCKLRLTCQPPYFHVRHHATSWFPSSLELRSLPLHSCIFMIWFSISHHLRFSILCKSSSNSIPSVSCLDLKPCTHFHLHHLLNVLTYSAVLHVNDLAVCCLWDAFCGWALWVSERKQISLITGRLAASAQCAHIQQWVQKVNINSSALSIFIPEAQFGILLSWPVHVYIKMSTWHCCQYWDIHTMIQ